MLLWLIMRQQVWRAVGISLCDRFYTKTFQCHCILWENVSQSIYRFYVKLIWTRRNTRKRDDRGSLPAWDLSQPSLFKDKKESIIPQLTPLTPSIAVVILHILRTTFALNNFCICRPTKMKSDTHIHWFQVSLLVLLSLMTGLTRSISQAKRVF